MIKKTRLCLLIVIISFYLSLPSLAMNQKDHELINPINYNPPILKVPTLPQTFEQSSSPQKQKSKNFQPLRASTKLELGIIDNTNFSQIPQNQLNQVPKTIPSLPSISQEPFSIPYPKHVHTTMPSLEELQDPNSSYNLKMQLLSDGQRTQHKNTSNPHLPFKIGKWKSAKRPQKSQLSLYHIRTTSTSWPFTQPQDLKKPNNN